MSFERDLFEKESNNFFALVGGNYDTNMEQAR